MNNWNLKIDEFKESIHSSFDHIAKDILTNWQLKVDEQLFSFTEIEFYFFCELIHEDNFTHEHTYDAGLWRFHNQGVDITFQSTNISDGGILIRGMKSKDGYVNGPRRILETIFRTCGSVTSVQHQFGLVPAIDTSPITIYKTARHGLSKAEGNEFKDNPYRYYTDLENWDKKHVSESEKFRIKSNSNQL
ncbi:MAG: hypothetical protein IPH88_15625 [Bacteroidales bacterium]|nr:hypothetical protein [Bacteroidales bacterium]